MLPSVFNRYNIHLLNSTAGAMCPSRRRLPKHTITPGLSADLTSCVRRNRVRGLESSILESRGSVHDHGVTRCPHPKGSFSPAFGLTDENQGWADVQQTAGLGSHRRLVSFRHQPNAMVPLFNYYSTSGGGMRSNRNERTS